MNHKQKVINYYNATHIDYRALWTGTDDLAVHFGYYDERATNHREALMRINEVLADLITVSSEDKVLDAGCGYGGSAMWLAENFGSEVTGITLSPLQAAKGQRYVAERGLQSKVRILEGDYSNLPFQDETFDVYWALESWVHAENRQRVYAEAMRVLKPNGRIVIAEYTVRENPPLSGSERAYLEPWITGWAMQPLKTPTELTSELSQVGFSNIKLQDATEHVKPSLKRLEILSILNYPIALFVGPLFFRPERLQNYYGSWRQINALKKGLWKYSIVTARKP